MRSVIKKYSDHISVPVMMAKPPAAPKEGAKAGQGCAGRVPRAVNAATALWTRPRTEVSDDEYKAFYKHISHDFEDPDLVPQQG